MANAAATGKSRIRWAIGFVLALPDGMVACLAMPLPVEPKSDSVVAKKKLKVFLVCSGLGHVNRGFESSTRECFDYLSDEPSLDLRLFKGGGKSAKKEIVLLNFPREQGLARKLGQFLKREAYWVEQTTYTLSLLPYLILQKPDLVMFCDIRVGKLLRRWKRLTGARFKILLFNGAPYSPPFLYSDHVQQMTPDNLERALQGGEAPESQTLLPHAFNVPPKRDPITRQEISDLRTRYGVPLNRPVVLCVGVINKHHKRTDYVIKEVALLPEPRPFLLMLGQREEETSSVLDLAEKLLRKDNFGVQTVPYEEVGNFYQLADVFVLGSLHEGFGRVVVEAMSYGLPCCVHDYANMRYLLGKFGYYGDFSVSGGLAPSLKQLTGEKRDDVDRQAQIHSAYECFSWDRLRPKYVKLFWKASGKLVDSL
jgi:glycosyltransferase involved in cell wall biosynthesis